MNWIKVVGKFLQELENILEKIGVLNIVQSGILLGVLAVCGPLHCWLDGNNEKNDYLKGL